jgi:hypothetical protein
MALWRVLVASFLLTAPAALAAAQPARQDEFVPVSQLPPAEQLPAAPLLVGAYVFVLVTLFVYVISVAKRVGAVQTEIARLEGELKTRTRQ